MQNHRSTPTLPGRRKQIVLALGLALGLATAQAQAGPSADTASHQHNDSPAAALMRRAAEAGIAVPADLPRFMERRASEKAKNGDATPKATITITNCNDSGPGSLRAAVAFASSGDVIDLTGSGCTSIALNSSIVTSVDDLTIRRDPGAGSSKYVVSGQNTIRPITHNGTGTLSLEGVNIAFGRVTGSPNGPVRGGCVYSQGSVALANEAQVKYCEARNTRTNGSPSAQGGAIFAADSVFLTDGARVANGKAFSAAGNAQGGGIHATHVDLSGALVEDNIAQLTGAGLGVAGGGIHTDSLQAKYSIVRKNKSVVLDSASALGARGGGAEIAGDGPSLIKYSTFNNNEVNAIGASAGGGAAITFGTSSATGSFEMRSSTIANNTTTNSTKYGGALSLRKNATIRSSTISGNIEKNAGTDIAESKYGAGITLDEGVQLTMTSSIVANNHAMRLTGSGAFPSDLGLSDREQDTASVMGTQNFYNFSHANITWQPGNLQTLVSVGLGPLQDNGGLTATMFPNLGSPVIDQGGTTGLGSLPGAPLVDQRGTGFPRVIGPQADIGAVEWSWRPEIFADGFESD